MARRRPKMPVASGRGRARAGSTPLDLDRSTVVGIVRRGTRREIAGESADQRRKQLSGLAVDPVESTTGGSRESKLRTVSPDSCLVGNSTSEMLTTPARRLSQRKLPGNLVPVIASDPAALEAPVEAAPVTDEEIEVVDGAGRQRGSHGEATPLAAPEDAWRSLSMRDRWHLRPRAS